MDKLFTTREETEAWLKQMNIVNYEIMDNLSVNVMWDVNLENKGLSYLPVRFNKISGDFYCSHNQLKSLQNTPRHVGRRFSCNNNQLISLKHGPIYVGNNYDCSYNQLESLEGAPEEIQYGGFSCEHNKLTHLRFSPRKIAVDFNCENNQLTSLEHGPIEVGGHYYAYSNALTSLKGAPKHIKDHLYCADNKITSFEDAPLKIDGNLMCSGNPINSLKNLPQIDGTLECDFKIFKDIMISEINIKENLVFAVTQEVEKIEYLMPFEEKASHQIIIPFSEFKRLMILHDLRKNLLQLPEKQSHTKRKI